MTGSSEGPGGSASFTFESREGKISGGALSGDKEKHGGLTLILGVFIELSGPQTTRPDSFVPSFLLKSAPMVGKSVAKSLCI